MPTATPIREAASNWKPAKCEVRVDDLTTGTHAGLSKGQTVNLYPAEAKQLEADGKVKILEWPFADPQKSKREAALEARLEKLEQGSGPKRGGTKS